jgi:hypothetical protein
MRKTVVIGCVTLASIGLAILLLPALTSGRCPPMPPAKVDMVCLRAALQQYHAEYGIWPTGNSSQILTALRGENPRKTCFFTPRSINSSGEFIDPWGTPYYIEFASTNRIFLRCAGRNKTFGDKDDITAER